MRCKMTGLERMRAARDQREDAVRAPIQELYDNALHYNRIVLSQWRHLQKVFAKGLEKPILEKIARDMGNVLEKAIRQACAKVRSPSEIATIVLPAHELLFGDRRLVQRKVFEAWLTEALEEIEVHPPAPYDLGQTAKDSVSYMRFELSVPPLHYRHNEMVK